MSDQRDTLALHLLLLLAKEVIQMSATLASIKSDVDAQGALIDQLAAEKTTVDQTLLDSIASGIEANNAKLAAAIAPTAPTTPADPSVPATS